MSNKAEEVPIKDLADAKHYVSVYPEPAVLLDPQTGAVVINDPALRLESILSDINNSDLRRLADKALKENRVLNETVTMPTISGQVLFQVNVMPGVRGGLVLFLFHDQTLDSNLRNALIESRQRFKDLVEVSSDFSWEIGEDNTFQFISRSGALGYSSDALTDRHPESLVVDAGEYEPLPFLTEELVENVELWMHQADGTMACVLVSAMPFYDADGTKAGVRGVCRDITEDRERESALSQAHQRDQILGYIVNTIRGELNPSDMFAAAAAATARALGAEGCNILRRDNLDNLDEQPRYELAATFGTGGPESFAEEFLVFNNGELWQREDLVDDWHIIAAPCQHMGQTNGVMCLWRRNSWSDDSRLILNDVAGQMGIAFAQIFNHENILHLSRTDAMTGLLNRRAFYEDELPRRFKRLAHDATSGALFFIDMDNFKLVNDLRGHQAGDEAIMALREIMHDFVRPGDLIARLGGDEFALWLDGVNEQTATSRCNDLMNAAQALATYSGGPSHPLSISVGIAVYHPESDESLASLLSRADEAMYKVKEGSKGNYELAAPPKSPSTRTSSGSSPSSSEDQGDTHV